MIIYLTSISLEPRAITVKPYFNEVFFSNHPKRCYLVIQCGNTLDQKSCINHVVHVGHGYNT